MRPEWLRCETCLFFAPPKPEEMLAGLCSLNPREVSKSPSEFCWSWTCRRCLQPWRYSNGDYPELDKRPKPGLNRKRQAGVCSIAVLICLFVVIQFAIGCQNKHLLGGIKFPTETPTVLFLKNGGVFNITDTINLKFGVMEEKLPPCGFINTKYISIFSKLFIFANEGYQGIMLRGKIINSWDNVSRFNSIKRYLSYGGRGATTVPQIKHGFKHYVPVFGSAFFFNYYFGRNISLFHVLKCYYAFNCSLSRFLGGGGGLLSNVNRGFHMFRMFLRNFGQFFSGSPQAPGVSNEQGVEKERKDYRNDIKRFFQVIVPMLILVSIGLCFLVERIGFVFYKRGFKRFAIGFLFVGFFVCGFGWLWFTWLYASLKGWP